MSFQLTRKREPVEARQETKAEVPNAGRTTLAEQGGKRGGNVEVSVVLEDSADSWHALEQNGRCASQEEEHS